MAQQQPVNYWINPSQRFSPEGVGLNVNSDSNHNLEVEPSQVDEENGSLNQLERESSLLSDNDFYSMVEPPSISRTVPSAPELNIPRTPSPNNYPPASPPTPRSAYKTPPTRRGHVNINESYNTTSYYSPLKYTPDPSKPVHFRPLTYAIDKKSGGSRRADVSNRDHGIPLRSALKKRAPKREEGGIRERRAFRPKNLNIEVESTSKPKESTARVVVDIPASPEPATSLSMENVTSSIEQAAKIIKENNRRLVKWRDDHTLKIDNIPLSSLDEISDLHKMIETLQKETAVMQQITVVQEKSLKGLKAQTTTLDEIQLELEREVTAKDSTIASMQAMLAEYKDQIASLEETANRKHDEFMKGKDQIGEVALLERQLGAEQTRAEELQNQLRNVHGEGAKIAGEERRKRGEFDRKIANLEAVVKNQEEEILKLREREASEKVQNSALRNELVLANREIERLKGQAANMGDEKLSEITSPNTFAKASELNIVVLELQRMLTKKNEEIDRLVKEMMRNVGRLQDRGPATQDMQQKLVLADKRVAELENAVLKKAMEVDKLTSELKSANDAINKVKESPLNHAQTSSSLEEVEKYKKLWQEQESLVKQREEALAHVKSALETMKKSSFTKEDEELFNQLIETDEEQIRELTLSLEKTQQRMHQLEAEVKEKDGIISDLKTTEEVVRSELVTLKEIMRERDERICELEEDAKRVRSAATDGSPKKFKTMYDLYENRIGGLQEQSHVAQERLLAVQGTIRHKNAELAKLSKAVDDKDRRIRGLLESLERLNREKNYAYDHATKKFEHRIASLRKSSEAKKVQIAEQEDLIARFHEHVNILSEQVADQRAQLAEKDAKVVKYYKMLKSYKETSEALQKSLSDKDKELDTTTTITPGSRAQIFTPTLAPSSTSRGSIISRPTMNETAPRSFLRRPLPMQSDGKRSALGAANASIEDDGNDLSRLSDRPTKDFMNSGNLSVAVR